MPTITVAEATFRGLSRRAAELNLTVEAVLDQVAAQSLANDRPETNATGRPQDKWKANFHAWMADVEARAERYPPGFEVDVSRESIYEGCGE